MTRQNALALFAGCLIILSTPFAARSQTNDSSNVASYYLLVKEKLLPLLDEHKDTDEARQIIGDLGKADPQLKDAILKGESESVVLEHFARLSRDRAMIYDSAIGQPFPIVAFVERSALKLSARYDKREYDKGNPESKLDFWSRNAHWVKTAVWFLAALLVGLLIRSRKLLARTRSALGDSVAITDTETGSDWLTKSLRWAGIAVSVVVCINLVDALLIEASVSGGVERRAILSSPTELIIVFCALVFGALIGGTDKSKKREQSAESRDLQERISNQSDGDLIGNTDDKTEVASEEDEEGWHCDACGGQVSFEDKICRHCGVDITEVAHDEDGNSSQNVGEEAKAVPGLAIKDD